MGKLKRRNPYKRGINQQADRFQKALAKHCAAEYLQNVKDQIFEEKTKELDDITSIYFMAYIALALHREFGFGPKRIARVLRAMDELDTQMCGMPLEEIKGITYKECGIIFQPAE